MCICSLNPSLLSLKSIKLNEDSIPIPIKIKSSSSRFRPTKVQFSEFQLKHPQWTKKEQAARLCLIPYVVKPYLGYQDHCFILNFVVYYMFLMGIFVKVYCIFVVAMFHAFCLPKKKKSKKSQTKGKKKIRKKKSKIKKRVWTKFFF